jgi:7,8-dihydroneopterin aldolase/epimerase/oxygenase
VDKIIIKDLEVEAQIGVTPEERSYNQRLLITIELERELAEAGRSDMESVTTGYDVVTAIVEQVVSERPRKLIEAIAHDVASAILTRRLAVGVTVEVKKFSIPRTKYVAVSIRRTQ